MSQKDYEKLPAQVQTSLTHPYHNTKYWILLGHQRDIHISKAGGRNFVSLLYWHIGLS